MDADADHDLLIRLNVKVDNLTGMVDRLITTNDTFASELHKMCDSCGMGEVKTDLAIEKTKTTIGWKILVGIPSVISLVVSLIVGLKP